VVRTPLISIAFFQILRAFRCHSPHDHANEGQAPMPSFQIFSASSRLGQVKPESADFQQLNLHLGITSLLLETWVNTATGRSSLGLVAYASFLTRQYANRR